MDRFRFKFRFWSKILSKFVTPDDNIFVGALKDDKMIVMQCTGLKDKDGKLIYEGDIVHFSVENECNEKGYERLEYCDIFFENGCFYAASCHLSDIYDVEIVGNIHQNPELLDENEND